MNELHEKFSTLKNVSIKGKNEIFRQLITLTSKTNSLPKKFLLHEILTSSEDVKYLMKLLGYKVEVTPYCGVQFLNFEVTQK